MPDVMTDKFAMKYGRSGSCGDELSEAVSNFLKNPSTGRMDPDKFRQLSEANSINPDKWRGLNNGQRRMMLGNVLRGMIRRGRPVKVGDIIFTRDGIDAVAS